MVWTYRHYLQRFLASKWGYYFTILLVIADLAFISLDMLTYIYMAEHNCGKEYDARGWTRAADALNYIVLSFACIFLAELIGTVFAFGLE